MPISAVFIEPKESKLTVLKRRFKKIGFLKTMGQVLFLTLIHPFISNRKKRITAILETNELNAPPLPENLVKPISSVHCEELIAAIKNEKPTVVFINGTRILKKKLLDAIDCPIVNIHVGITPKYRGVHGGFWALQKGDSELFGVTLHYVDRGIDTGRLIAQMVLPVNEKDNFKTYPILQYCAGIRLLEENLEAIIQDQVNSPTPLTDVSRLHYHPTLLEYFKGG